MNEVAANAAGEGSRAGTGNATGAADNWNPVLIALVRRAMPNLMAYDVCGVQPMTGPTGLIFAMRAVYQTAHAGAGAAGTEALFNEAQTQYSGDSVEDTTGNGGYGLNGGRGPSGLVGATDTDADSSIADSGGVYAPVVGVAMDTYKAESIGNSWWKFFPRNGIHH